MGSARPREIPISAPPTMPNASLVRNGTRFALAALLIAPVAAPAVELGGFSLGASRGATLAQLSSVAPPGAVIRCRVDSRTGAEDCTASRSGTRFVVLGLPLEKLSVEFWSDTTEAVEFHFRAQGNGERTYMALLQAVTEKLSAPTERDANRVRWESDGYVATLRTVEGGGIALSLTRTSTKAHEYSSNVASVARRRDLVAQARRTSKRSNV